MTTNDEARARARAADPAATEHDVDRGVLFGAAVALAMTFLLQAMIAGCYQLATRGDGELMAPVRFGGFTQLMYIAPTALLFIQRKCPKMATGVGIVAGAVFFANVVWVLV